MSLLADTVLLFKDANQLLKIYYSCRFDFDFAFAKPSNFFSQQLL